ncbi:MAG: esterase-like activity of phytase family protein, partial [Thermaurantiacus tibetensis]
MIRTVLASVALLASAPALASVTFTGMWAVPGGATDLSGISPAFAGNRLSFGSDLFYDRASGTFWGNTDRGPGGGVISFQPRVHQFTLDIQPDGSVTGFSLLKTVTFTHPDGRPFDGLNPLLLNGDKSVLGLSHDPEGLVVLPNGHFLVADEYGPSLYEFDANGVFLRAFETPSNLLPRRADGTLNFVDGRGAPAGERVETGRQDNRGFEGLTLSRDGKQAIAVLQDPLMEEGGPGGREGRRSRNVRVVVYDIASGKPVAQYIYQLEALADINARIGQIRTQIERTTSDYD